MEKKDYEELKDKPVEELTEKQQQDIASYEKEHGTETE